MIIIRLHLEPKEKKRELNKALIKRRRREMNVPSVRSLKSPDIRGILSVSRDYCSLACCCSYCLHELMSLFLVSLSSLNVIGI